MANNNLKKIPETALTEMSKKVHDEFSKKTIPAPTNKNAIAAYRKNWQKKLNDKISLIERREHAGYYNNNPEAMKKDYDDAYYARFIIRISDEDWNKYLK